MRYGLSFAGGPAEEKMELADFPYDIFPIAELPGDMMQTSRPTKQLIFECFERLHFRNLFPAPMCRSMALQNRTIIRMFREQLRKVMRRCDDLNAASICLDFGVGSAVSDSDFRVEMLALINEITADLNGHSARLLIPARVPEPVPQDFYNHLLCDSMNPFLSLSCDIHPHELAGKDYSTTQLLNPIKYDLKIMRLLYEPETGNRLVKKLVEPWIRYLQDNSLPVDLIFCPLATNPEVFEKEIFRLAEMVAEINTVED